MKMKVSFGIGIAVVLILIVGTVIYLRLSSFPGKIQTISSQSVDLDGVTSTFHQGAVYRYPGMVPMLEVKGDHYEMGLQYGVLLRPELMKAISSYEKILRWQADDLGIPYRLLVAVAKFKAKQIGKRVPERFLQEIQGVSDGSGMPFDTILTVSLFYDIQMAISCSGLLMRGEDGRIIHGRNQDATFFGGEEVAKLSVVVKYQPEGYHTVTQQDFLLFLGIETGYNDQGLGFSEETLPIKKANKRGKSMVYFTRMALEECSNLEEVRKMLDEYSFIGGYGMVWSDRDQGQSMVAEVAGDKWAPIEMKDSLLWNFNRIYGREMKQYQAPRADLYGHSLDREEIAALFPKKSTYTLDDAFAFLRAREGVDGRDYSWTGSKTSIVNHHTQQMIIFDPHSDGFYYGLGTYFGGLHEVYHIFDDFSKKPVLVKERVPLQPIVEEAARIENMLINAQEKLAKYRQLADDYPQDAKAQFKVAFEMLRLGKVDYFADYAEKAYNLDPTLEEYQLFAGLAAYQHQEYDQTVQLVNDLDQSRLNPEQTLYRLTLLERIYQRRDLDLATKIKAEREQIIQKYAAEDYYQKRIEPKIKSLES